VNKCFFIVLISIITGCTPAVGQVSYKKAEDRAARKEARQEKKERRINHSKKEKRRLKKAIKRELREEAEDDKIRNQKILEYMRRTKQK